jgi:hypothetical protein
MAIEVFPKAVGPQITITFGFTTGVLIIDNNLAF